MAVADDPSAAYYNPAGLAQLGSPQLVLSHNKYFEDITQQWFAAASPVGSGAVGAAVNYLSIPPFPSYSAADARTGSVSAYDLAASLSYANSLPIGNDSFDALLYGVTARSVTQKLDSESANGYGIDAGLLLKPYGDGLSLAVAADNVYSTKLKFIDQGFRQARTVKAGGAYRLPAESGAVTVSAAWGFPDDGPGYMAAGVEKSVAGLFTLRGGFNSFGEVAQGFSLGFGLKVPAFSGNAMEVDYSFSSTYDLGAIHKIGLLYRFGPAATRRPGKRPAIEAQELKDPQEIPAAAYKDILNSGKTQERLAVIRELGTANWKKSKELLLPLLESGREDLRSAAAAAIKAALRRGTDPAASAEMKAALRATEEKE
jgi:hypothetical protein